MLTIEIVFKTRQARDRARAEDELQAYLAALERNGQIVGDTPTARVRGGYRVFANVPRSDAVEPRRSSKRLRDAAARLSAAGLKKPVFRRIGPEPDTRPACSCRRPPYFVLFANFLSDAPPVRCGRCFGAVPLYTLPTTRDAGDYQDLLSWQRTYQAMDWLFVGSGAGERYGHRQMLEHRSALSREGRELAATLEARTRRPVYYYLMKHFGVSEGRERRRKCPSCRKTWTLPAPLHRIFDFRCDACRLLSNIAFDVRLPGSA